MGCVYSRSCIGTSCVPRIKQVKKVKAAEYGVFSPRSEFQDDEDDQFQDLNQLSFGRDTEAGIKRLSRVSSQFLPPDGSRTVRIPSENYELRCSFLSQRGYYPDALDKANQDSFCIHTPFGPNPNDHFFGVFDGHGEFGAECSQFVKRKLCENLLRNTRFHTDPIEACHASFLTTNSQLHADENLDDTMSGTTAITVLVRGRSICVANTGDSRAVIAQKKGNELVAVDLSIDQTPFRSDEIERVKQCGARVLTLDQIEGLKNPDVQCWGTEEGDDGDPPRLWVENGMYPGTAFTRSIGDSIAESIGVVPNPEIVVLELTPEYPFFVIASDGVFEFLSSQAVVDMVAKCKEPRDACAAIVAESYRLWLQYETRTDDITIIVVHINGLSDDTTRGSSPIMNNSPVPQSLELTGSESPATTALNSGNQRVRHDVSRARLRAIESSLESGNAWVPPPSSHRKTWEEEAHIERALHDHFLFRKLTDSQCHVLLDCMQRIEVQAGKIVVEQGGEGDCFFVVGSGEFEVFATQEEKNGEVPKVLQRYTADKLSCFGELALMYNKPLQATVRCVTSGTLWTLKREDFRGILVSEFSNLSSLKLLRSVDLLSRLTILQLSQIANSLSEVSFSDGQLIVGEHEYLNALYIIQKERVLIEFDVDVLESPNIYSLKSDTQIHDDDIQSKGRLKIEKPEGSYFGEWAVLGEQVNKINIHAIGDVMCSVLTKEQFDSVVGPLTRLSQDSHKLKELQVDPITKEPDRTVGPLAPQNAQLFDLEWKRCLYSTDCSEIGLVHLIGSENLFSLKRFLKQKVKKLGKEEQVLNEKKLMRSLNNSIFLPEILCTCADETHTGILLNTTLACPLASILWKPLDESSACFCAASVVIALENLHQNGILYRGISPDVLMFDQMGRLKFVDFRFGKKLTDERTYTICGMADSLAPEIVLGKGHGLSADWWSLGVLIYFMLQGDMPFGSWRENELDTLARIAKGQFNLPQSCSPEATDLINKLLQVDETNRLGSLGSESVKKHLWFAQIDWIGFVDQTSPVPPEIVSRISHHLDTTSPEECSFPPSSPFQDVEGLNSREWLEDW